MKRAVIRVTPENILWRGMRRIMAKGKFSLQMEKGKVLKN
jgi:hypothetical protein